MTAREMMKLRLDGVSLQKIADMCGISKQAVHQKLDKFYREELNGHIRCKFDIDTIVFQGIYEYFENNPKLTLERFYRELNISSSKENVRKLIKGEINAKLNIPQINRICEVVGKPYEEVFKEREI